MPYQHKTTCETSFQGHPIQAYPEHELDCLTAILQRIYDIFSDMTGRHCRVTLFRFDLHFPANKACPSDNDLIRRAISNLVLHARRDGIDIRHLWAREDTDGGRCHWHLALWLDGSKVVRAFHWLRLLENLWSQALGLAEGEGKGLVEHCPAIVGDKSTDGLMLVRGAPEFQETLDHGVYWLSYISKSRGKESTPVGASCFGGSLARP